MSNKSKSIYLTLPDSTLNRAAWERLIEACDARVARRAMLELLALAHERSCEAVLAVALTQQLLEGGMPDLAILRTRFAPSPTGHLHLPQHFKSAACGANVTLLKQHVQQLLVTLLFLGGITDEHGVASR